MSIIRISVGADGGEPSNHSRSGVSSALSADGRYIVFESAADNLVHGDDNGVMDVFLYDRVSGTTSIVSLDEGGAQGTARSFDGTISADGRYVAFKTEASNIGGDTSTKIVRKDLTTGAIVVVGDGRDHDNNSTEPAISADGRFIAYNTGGISGTSYRYDVLNDVTVPINAFPDGTIDGGIATAVRDISDDGRYVAFYSDVHFDEGDGGPSGIGYDLHIRDMDNGEIRRISNSIATPGQNANGDSFGGDFSSDGRFLVYHTFASDVFPGDVNQHGDVIRYNLLTGESEVVTLTAEGAQTSGPGFGSISASVSGDGRYVVFESSATNLRPGDTNGVQEIFVKDMVTGAVQCVSIAADGAQTNNNSFNASISSNGRFVVFTSDANMLVPGDDGMRDVFLVDLADTGFWQATSHAPDAEADTFTTDEDTPTTGNVLANDRDPDAGDALAVTNAGTFDTAHGSVTLAADGNFSYTPDANWSGSDSFEYTVRDATGLTASATAGIVVAPVADAPTVGLSIPAAPVPVGGESIVFPIGHNNVAAVAALDDGGFVVTWMYFAGANSFDVLGQVYNADGTGRGQPFAVAQQPGWQGYQDVVGLTDGGFVVAMDSYSGSDILLSGRAFDVNGTPRGDLFNIGGASGTQDFPALAALEDGGFVAAWQTGLAPERNIVVRAFDGDGAPRGPAAVIATGGETDNYYADIVALGPNGRFLVTWTQHDPDGSGDTVRGRIVESSGAPTNGDFEISDSATTFTNITVGSSGQREEHQFRSFAAALSDGTAVVTWVSDAAGSYDVFARRLDASGDPIGPSFQVNSHAPNDQLRPHVTGLADGGFLVTWHSWLQDGSLDGVFGQRYLADGTAAGGELPISEHSGNRQYYPSAVPVGENGFVAAWTTAANRAPDDLTIAIRQFSFDIGVVGRNALAGVEGQSVTLPLSVSLTDTDGSEDIASIVVTGLPPGFSLSAGTRSEDGSWSLTPAQLTGLALIPAPNFSGSLTLTVTATSRELANGNTASTSAEITVNFVNDDDDAPTGIQISHSSVDEHVRNGTVVGTLSATDPDDTTGFTFTLVNLDGTSGYTGPIAIGGSAHNLLVVANGVALDFEQDATHEVRVRVRDSSGLSHDQTLTISIRDVSPDIVIGTPGSEVIWGGAGHDRLRGMGGDDTIVGGDGRDIIFGDGGVNDLYGGAGNDVYAVREQGTQRIHEDADAGTDAVQATISYTLGAEIEYLRLVGPGDIDGTGNRADNYVWGNSGANVLDGREGIDVLIGGAGADAFLFSTALDRTTNADRIRDFSHADDSILLDHTIFAAIGELGTLDEDAFYIIGSAASVDAEDRILYNAERGILYYDADGQVAGSAAAVAFAVLNTRPADLDNSDFIVV